MAVDRVEHPLEVPAHVVGRLRLGNAARDVDGQVRRLQLPFDLGDFLQIYFKEILVEVVGLEGVRAFKSGHLGLPPDALLEELPLHVLKQFGHFLGRDLFFQPKGEICWN